jgi:hypothetical protein
VDEKPASGQTENEKLYVGDSPIPLYMPSIPLELEVWLQPQKPEEFGLAHTPVSVTGGETRAEAEFEIRMDSDNFRSDKSSQTVAAQINAKSPSQRYLKFASAGRLSDDLVVWTRTREGDRWRHSQSCLAACCSLYTTVLIVW